MTEEKKNKLLVLAVSLLMILSVGLLTWFCLSREGKTTTKVVIKTVRDTVYHDTTIFIQVPAPPIEEKPVPDIPGHDRDSSEDLHAQRVQKHYSDSVNSVKYDIFVSGIRPDLDSCSFSYKKEVITNTVTKEKIVETTVPFRGVAIGPMVQIDYGNGPGAVAAAEVSWVNGRHRISLDVGERYEYHVGFKPYVGFRYTFDMLWFPSKKR